MFVLAGGNLLEQKRIVKYVKASELIAFHVSVQHAIGRRCRGAFCARHRLTEAQQ